MAREFLDGGVRTLRLGVRVEGGVTVVDMRDGSTFDAGRYVVQAQSVRRVSGRFGPGKRRWRVDYEPAVTVSEDSTDVDGLLVD